MCLRYVLVSNHKVIEDRFKATLLPGLAAIPKSYAVALGDSSYVITDPNAIQVFRYGLTPHFASEPLNICTARSEGNKNGNDDPNYNGSKAIFLQPEFNKAIFSQRCIVVADAYYEWSDKGIPFLVYLRNKYRPFGFAGIYDTWQNPETKDITTSLAIITTTANEMLHRIGVKRMPVILPLLYETEWLKTSLPLSEILRFLVPFPSQKMNAYPVTALVNSDEINDASLLIPAGEKLQLENNPQPTIRSRYYHKSKPVSDKPWFRVQEFNTVN